MKAEASIWIGLSGMAIGLAVGYLIPRGAPLVTTSESISVSTKGSRVAAKNPESQQKDRSRNLLQSIPDKYTAREEWLDQLASPDLAALIEGLCDQVGPDGLESESKSLLENALKKWWKNDRESALAWVMNLPSGAKKRFLMKFVLSELLKDDTSQALVLSEAFQAEDPKWDHISFNDKYVDLIIDKAWEKPNATADGMLDLFSRLSRGNAYSGTALGRYPENFDFARFLDGIASQHKKDGKHPSGMPTDVLEGWARVDAQAAAQWYLDSIENGADFPFQKWDNIAQTVSTRNGPQAYHQWAAAVIAQTSEEQRKEIFESVSDQDAVGIASSINDTLLRDEVFARMARKNSGTVGKLDQTVDFLAKISTPEARLQAIKNDGSQYAWWFEQYPPDSATWLKLGLTREQVTPMLFEER
jgi:hypothetical protein